MKSYNSIRIAIPPRKDKLFLLCGSCGWCATCVNTRVIIEECPSCVDGLVESIPISDNEIYNFRHDAIRGVTLEFTLNG
jgi:hypothetical protein